MLLNMNQNNLKIGIFGFGALIPKLDVFIAFTNNFN